MKKQATVITGTVGMDAHVIGTKILSRALRDAGFNVVELGMQVPPEEFIEVAQETKADAILMTSLYGMAELDLRGFKENCKQAGEDRGKKASRTASRKTRKTQSPIQKTVTVPFYPSLFIPLFYSTLFPEVSTNPTSALTA